jgi:cell division protein FtsQ
MKKINFKKIGIIVLWFLGVSGLVVTLGFVNNREAFVKGKSVTVNINQNDENSFVDEDDILKFLQDRHDTLINKPMSEINVYELEKCLNAHPSIANAEVAVSVSGDVTINVTQRKPIVRIINTQGESFYLDNKATLMPLADHYTARVLVVNGIITESYSQFYNFSVPQIEKDSALSKATVLDDIYEVVTYINKDSLLTGLVTQMYINNEREIELYPAVGNQKIIFGDATGIEDKFEKLKIFYREGLNSINNWNRYSTINLKYKNQVVCTKKETQKLK